MAQICLLYVFTIINIIISALSFSLGTTAYPGLRPLKSRPALLPHTHTHTRTRTRTLAQMGKRDYAAVALDMGGGSAVSVATTAERADSTGDILDVICTRMMSPGAGVEERIQACALLASSPFPLETILSRKGSVLLPTLLAWMAENDIILAAEAASVLRAWTQEGEEGEELDEVKHEGEDSTNMSPSSQETTAIGRKIGGGQENTRRLYAHQMFPPILSLLSLAAQRLAAPELVERSREELLSLEHWLGSLLLVTWAILELIPAALHQLPGSALGFLSVMVLEKASFLPVGDTRIILLRCLLCACEKYTDGDHEYDGPEIFTDIDRVRLESHLGKLINNSGSGTQVRVLSFALAQILSGSSVQAEHVRFICGLISSTDVEEHLVDIFEVLANYLTEVPSLGQVLTKEIFSILLDRIARCSAGAERGVKRGYVQRILSCLLNLISSTDDLDTELIQCIWTTLIGLAQTIYGTLNVDEVTMTLIGRSLRGSLIPCHASGWYPCVSDADGFVTIVRSLFVNSNVSEDAIATWISLPSIILPSLGAEVIAWYQQVVGQLFRPDRSVAVLVSAVEIVERLALLGSLTETLRGHLRTSLRPIGQAIRRAAKERDDNYEEELAYIESTLRSIM